jgi:galactitol-specific phosphotransferase system IIB component
MTEQIIVQSFGFLHGVPDTSGEGVLLIDLRTALRNPADNRQLVKLTGLHEAVYQHVLATPGAIETIEQTVRQTRALAKGTRRSDRPVRVLVGCQGGRHRSVVVAHEVHRLLADAGHQVKVEHLHVDRPVVRPAPVVAICGSTRFWDEMAAANRYMTAQGKIVLAPGCNMKIPDPLWADPEQAEALKIRLDALHQAKIRMADEVLVVSDASSYVGESTIREVDYAYRLGLPVRYWRGGPPKDATMEDDSTNTPEGERI